MATYQGQALLNYPDSYGQFYQSTPSIAPMKTVLGWESDYASPSSTSRPSIVPKNYYNYHNSLYESSTNRDEEDEEFEDYYYDQPGQVITASPDSENNQQHYVDDYDRLDYSKINGKKSDYVSKTQDKVYNPKVGEADPEDLDNRIRNIRKNDDIFR